MSETSPNGKGQSPSTSTVSSGAPNPSEPRAIPPPKRRGRPAGVPNRPRAETPLEESFRQAEKERKLPDNEAERARLLEPYRQAVESVLVGLSYFAVQMHTHPIGKEEMESGKTVWGQAAYLYVPEIHPLVACFTWSAAFVLTRLPEYNVWKAEEEKRKKTEREMGPMVRVVPPKPPVGVAGEG